MPGRKKLRISFGPDGRAVEEWVPLSAEEQAVAHQDEAAATERITAATDAAMMAERHRADLTARQELAAVLADKLDAGTMSAGETSQALSLLLHAYAEGSS